MVAIVDLVASAVLLVLVIIDGPSPIAPLLVIGMVVGVAIALVLLSSDIKSVRVGRDGVVMKTLIGTTIDVPWSSLRKTPRLVAPSDTRVGYQILSGGTLSRLFSSRGFSRFVYLTEDVSKLVDRTRKDR